MSNLTWHEIVSQPIPPKDRLVLLSALGTKPTDALATAIGASTNIPITEVEVRLADLRQAGWRIDCGKIAKSAA